METITRLGKWVQLWVVLVTLAALLPAIPVQAKSGTAALRFSPNVQKIGEGQVEKVDLILEDARGIYALDVRGAFDPLAVEIVDMDSQQEGVQMTPGSFPKPDFVVRNIADNTAGTFMYVLTQVNPTPPATGEGVVLSIYFRGKANGKSSRLAVNFVESADRRGSKLVVQPDESKLLVVKPKSPTPTPRIMASAQPASQADADQTAGPNTNSGGQTKGQADYAHPLNIQNAPTDLPSSGSGAQERTLLAIAVGGFAGAAAFTGAAGIIVARRRWSFANARKLLENNRE